MKKIAIIILSIFMMSCNMNKEELTHKVLIGKNFDMIENGLKVKAQLSFSKEVINFEHSGDPLNLFINSSSFEKGVFIFDVIAYPDVKVTYDSSTGILLLTQDKEKSKFIERKGN